MNIFLDTNAFYKDPFLAKGKNRILLKLAELEDVKLFINKTVYSELYRAHKTFIDRELKTVNDAYTNIKPFLGEDSQSSILEIELDDLMDDYESHFDRFEENEQLEVIDYDSEVLEHIVEIDMYEKPPFIKNKKKEIRDAIIWYSYKLYIEKNGLEDCYFISNNHKEFGELGSDKAPKEEPYSIHPEILGELNITAYKTIHDFLTHNEDEIKLLCGQLISDTLLESIKDELEGGLADDIIMTFFNNQIISETESFIADENVERIHYDYFMGGYASPDTDGRITKVSLYDVEVYGDDITVTIDLEVEIDVHIYLYNSIHEGKDDKFVYHDTDTIKFKESAVFIIHVDTDEIIGTENFSLKKYIHQHEPCNLDVEIVEWENISHNDMFPEDEFDYGKL